LVRFRYHSLYMLSKGNTFKHKRAIIEEIHKQKAEYEALLLILTLMKLQSSTYKSSPRSNGSPSSQGQGCSREATEQNSRKEKCAWCRRGCRSSSGGNEIDGLVLMVMSGRVSFLVFVSGFTVSLFVMHTYYEGILTNIAGFHF